MKFSPEQAASLLRTVSLPSKVSLLIPANADQIYNFIDALRSAIGAHREQLHDIHLLFVFAPSQSGGQRINDFALRKYRAAAENILTLGNDQTIVAARSGEASFAAGSDLSGVGPTLVALWCDPWLIVYCGGKVLDQIHFPLQEEEIQTTPWRHRPWWELRLSLDDHFHHCVKLEQFPYWARKSERKLLAGTRGTELMFHAPLFWWCKHFLADVVAVHGETLGLGQQKTDITVVTSSSGSIVIEVKWLGENESGTTYNQDRIAEGMVQVREYLTNDPALIQGYVVLYDGRSEDEHAKSSGYDPALKHLKCEAPIIFFLPSETPSATGVKVVKNLAAAKKAVAKKAVAKKAAAKKAAAKKTGGNP